MEGLKPMPLPIYVSQDLRMANPRFNELLERLNAIIAPMGERKALKESYEKAEAALRVERERHLRVGALYTEAKDIIATRRLQSRAKGSSSLPGATPKVYDSMHNVILAAEVTHSLVLEPPTATAPGGDKPTTPHRGEASGKPCVTLLGLKKEDIELAIASKAPSKFAEERQELYQYIIAELDERLRRKVQEIAEFNDPLGSPQTLAKSNKKSPPIAEVIAKKKEQLLAERKQLDVDGLTAALSFAEYCQVLDKTFQVVSEILRDFKLSQQFNQDQVYSKWLQANCQHLINRLQLLQSQVLRDTYTPSKVAALTKVRQHLECAIEETMAQHEEAVEQIQRYERAGAGFDGLVREYASLLEELAQKKWTIERIKV